MSIRIAVCREVGKSPTPVLVSRHIMIPIVVCREYRDVDINLYSLPNEIIELINRNGYAIIEDQNYALKLFGINLSDNEYVKISIKKSNSKD